MPRPFRSRVYARRVSLLSMLVSSLADARPSPIFQGDHRPSLFACFEDDNACPAGGQAWTGGIRFRNAGGEYQGCVKVLAIAGRAGVTGVAGGS